MKEKLENGKTFACQTGFVEREIRRNVSLWRNNDLNNNVVANSSRHLNLCNNFETTCRKLRFAIYQTNLSLDYVVVSAPLVNRGVCAMHSVHTVSIFDKLILNDSIVILQ